MFSYFKLELEVYDSYSFWHLGIFGVLTGSVEYVFIGNTEGKEVFIAEIIYFF
jgi:hypothetical protein